MDRLRDEAPKDLTPEERQSRLIERFLKIDRLKENRGVDREFDDVARTARDCLAPLELEPDGDMFRDYFYIFARHAHRVIFDLPRQPDALAIKDANHKMFDFIGLILITLNYPDHVDQGPELESANPVLT